jgi:ParB family chromosome partitioning protein
MPPPPVVIPPVPDRGSSASGLETAALPAAPPPGEIAELGPGREVRRHGFDRERPAGAANIGVPEEDVVQQIPLHLIDGNPYQTRRTFDPAALHELADSIRESGLAQPVVVRPGADGRYLLVLGERRCRASRMAGKETVPAIVRALGNERAAELTVIENLQRQDLNCLEQAQAFARLSREFNLTQEQIGKRVGTSRESVANYVRLLKLPQPVQELIGEGKLGFSEARVLLEALPHVEAGAIVSMALSAVEGRLTVRDLKTKVEQLIAPRFDPPEPPKEKPVDPNVRDAERRLREALGMRVRVMANHGNKGQVVIRYESLADFDRIFERLSREIG